MRKAIFIVMGAILAVGIAFAQTDPWWHPLNPQGASAGVSYGTQLPTLVNTGLQPTDGLLAVQITTGAVPTLNMYTQSTATWFTFGMLPAAGLTDDTVPVWDTATNSFIDSGIVDDAVTITITSATDTLIPIGQLEVGDGLVGAPAYSFVSDDTLGVYVVAANNLGISIGGALVMDLEDTNAAGAGADLVTISSTLGIMDDGADVVRGLTVDLTNVDHTGGNVYGINVLALGGVGADANANEIAVNIANNWDYGLSIATQVTAELFFNVPGRDAHVRYRSHDLTFSDAGLGGVIVFTLNNFPDAVADYAKLFMVGVGDGTDTIAAMDNADEYAMLKVDFVNADHGGTTNDLRGIAVDAITEDPQAYETGLHLGGGWDTHITFVETGQAPTAAEDYPDTGEIGLFVDDNVDYSGGGGVDCALMLIDSTGALDVVTIIVTNGACP